MLLALFTLLIQIACLWSIYSLIWRYDTSKKNFGWIHLILIFIYGFFSFIILFLMALGSTGHFVVSDFEELMADITMYIGMFGSFLSLIGTIIATVKLIRNRKR